MWRTLTFLFVITNLLRLGVSQADGNSSTTPAPAPPSGDTSSTPASTVPGGSTPGGNGTDSTKCMTPTEMLTEPFRQVNVLNALNKLREKMPMIKPKNHGACPLQKLNWDDKLAKSAHDEAMACPMPSVGPNMIAFTSRQLGGTVGEIVAFAMSSSKLTLGTDETIWTKPVMAMTDEEFKDVVTSYKMGPWDPIFQVMWSGTKSVGCSLVAYNNSDLAGMSIIFNTTITNTTELESLVCHFSPPGCMQGDKPWNFCGFSPPTDGPSPGPGPVPDDSTTPNEDPSDEPTNPTSDVPFAAGTRVSAETGFNFETLSIASIIIGHLVHFLISFA